MSSLASLSVAAALEKSRMASDAPWFMFAKIVWPDGSVLRLVKNTDDVTFDAQDGAGAQTWLAFNWDFGQLEETADGSIPPYVVKCSNVTRAVEAYLEDYGGGVGGTIILYIANAKRMKSEVDLELEFSITQVSSNAAQVTFTLGAPNPLKLLFPRHVYTADTCVWTYKSPQCGYSGSKPTCSLQLGGDNGCRAHGNTNRFGACPGIDSNGVHSVSVR